MTVVEDAGWIIKRPKLEKFKERRVRVRWITKDEARSLLNNLTIPWMRDVCAFALATGASMGETLNLEWRDVDLSKKHRMGEGGQSKVRLGKTIALKFRCAEYSGAELAGIENGYSQGILVRTPLT